MERESYKYDINQVVGIGLIKRMTFVRWPWGRLGDRHSRQAGEREHMSTCVNGRA